MNTALRITLGLLVGFAIVGVVTACVKTNINFVLTQDNATAPEISKVQVKSPDQVEVHEQVSTGELEVNKGDTTDTFSPEGPSKSLELQIK